jgi:hypothetical protein
MVSKLFGSIVPLQFKNKIQLVMHLDHSVAGEANSDFQLEYTIVSHNLQRIS